MKNFTSTSINSKKLNGIEILISFFIETLDEFPTRLVKSLIVEIALETSIYPEI